MALPSSSSSTSRARRHVVRLSAAHLPPPAPLLSQLVAVRLGVAFRRGHVLSLLILCSLPCFPRLGAAPCRLPVRRSPPLTVSPLPPLSAPSFLLR